MDSYELILHDLMDILKSVGEVNHVSHGKTTPLDTEDTFTAVYIKPEADMFEQESITGYGASSYDNKLYIRLEVNMDCTGDDLLWVRTRRKIIDAILDDNAIWNNIINRDIISVAHDDYILWPRKAMAMLFEFQVRENCVI